MITRVCLLPLIYLSSSRTFLLLYLISSFSRSDLAEGNIEANVWHRASPLPRALNSTFGTFVYSSMHSCLFIFLYLSFISFLLFHSCHSFLSLLLLIDSSYSCFSIDGWFAHTTITRDIFDFLKYPLHPFLALAYLFLTSTSVDHP